MAKVTIGFAVALIVLGVGAYLVTGMQSWTALIPAIIGAVLGALGVWALNPAWRKTAMHIAVVVAVLSVFGTFGGVMAVFRWIGGTEPPRPEAAVVQSITAVLLVVFIVMCVQSFIAARRQRDTGFDVIPKT